MGWQAQKPRRLALVATVALHLLGALALLQAGRTVVRAASAQPLEVRLLHDSPSPAPLPAPAPLPRTVPVPAPLLPNIPLPEFEAPSARPAAIQAQAPQMQSAPAVATAPTPVAQAPAAPVASPKPVAASALRYRIEPAVEVPLLSRRAGEAGRVGLRVVFDTQGRPRDIQLQRSSGFARLDAQALTAMQGARIVPIVEDGRAIEVVAIAWLEYELD